MKKIVLTFAMVLMAFITGSSYAQVGIGTMTPDKSSALDVTADSLGVLVPRMTESGRDNIQDPSNGLLIYNTDEGCFNVFNLNGTDSTWTSLCGGMAKAKFTVASCSDITVNGAYVEGTPLNSSNYLSVIVDVTKAGSYTFTATTENGYGFTGSGTILDAPATVTLMIPGQGTPKVQNQTPGDLVTFNSSGGDINCTNMTIKVLPATATYDIICGSIKANGAYVKNVALDPTNNTITLLVNVTDISNGANSYTVRTNTNNGISFLGSGTFNATGQQQVILQGTGTPNTTDPIPLTLTANSASGESTCNTTITVAYPLMSVYTIGDLPGDPDALYMYGYNVGYDGVGAGTLTTHTGSYGMLTSPANFGINANSTVKAQGFKFTVANETTTGSQIDAAINGATNRPDIVVFGYNWTNSDGTAATAILKYLQDGGVVLMYCENAATVQLVMRAVFGDQSITTGAGGTAGSRYQIPMLNSDPVINGPFGNLGGLYWGEDASTTVTVSGIANNSSCIVYSTTTSGVTACRNSSLKLLWTGDGGFNSDNQGADATICPFHVVDATNYVPSDKPSYGPGSVGGTGPVCNSRFSANAMAWAISAAMDHGVNLH